jgi:hypothetical protein
MPLPAVYAVLRENGFSPLGIPHQRGYLWVIAAVDRAGQDGRLVIDGRSGQIIRFAPTYRWGSAYDRMRYDGGPPPSGAQAAPPPPTVVRDPPRPPAPVPQLANRGVPMSAPKPVASSKPAAAPRQSALVAARPAQAPAAAQPQVAPPPQPGASFAQSKPAPQILPTQQMPKVQGLE